MALPNTNGVFIHQGYNCSPNLIPTGQSIQVSSTDTTPVSNAVNALDQNFANQYDSTTSYGLGDWCIYNHNLYQCTTAITTPEEWDSDHWQARAATNQDINSLRDVQIDASTLTAGQALVYNNGHWENGAGGGGATSLDDLTDVELTTPAANETLVCEIVNNDPVFKNKATTWTGTEAQYNAILVKDPNVTYYITDGDSDARYIICTQAQYNAWKTAGTLESDTPYYITDAENSGVVINDNITTSTEVWSSLKVSNSLEAVKDELHETVGADVYDHTATYAVDDLCIYNNILYKCTTAITTAEAWNSDHWTATSIKALLALKQNSTDSTLTTSSQTVVGAINELKSKKQDNLSVINLTNTVRLNSNCTVHHGYVSKYGRIIDFSLVIKVTGNINNNDVIIYGLPKANNNCRCPKALSTNEYYANDYTSGGLAIDTDDNDPTLAIVRNFSNITATSSNPKYIFMCFSYISMN